MLRLEDIPRSDIEAIHRATMTVLREVGVKFPEKLAFKKLETVGAEIDYQRQIARFPEEVIKKALGQAPQQFTMYARRKEQDIRVGQGKTYFKTSSIGIAVQDFETGKRRGSTKEDVVKTARLVDALPNIHVLDPMVSPGEVPTKLFDYYRLQLSLENSSKHICTLPGPATGTKEAGDVIEIASCVVGGKDELTKRPIISLIQEATSPLQYEPLGLQAMMEFAKYNIPISISTLPAGGATAPMTLAGELVVANAEILSGITLVQAVRPGCPVFCASFASVMDPRSGVFLLGCMERPLMHAYLVNLARYYKIPSMVGGLNTDATIPGSQSTFEKTATTLPLTLAGADIIHGAGCINSALTYSFEQLVMDDEIAGAISKITNGLEVNEETLALDAIKKIGIGGHFLAEKHTLAHFQEVWRPTLYRRDSKSEDFTREATLDRDLAKSAKEKARKILETHQPAPLDEDVRRKMRKIVADAEKLI